MSGITFLKQNPSKLGWDSPIRKMVCGLSFLLWLALLQTSLAVNVPGPNGTVITQILSATSSNPEVKVVEDRDLGKILVYPPQPKEFTVEIIARIMYPDDQYLEKISTVMVGGAGVTIESSEIRNSLILATLKVAPGASGGRFSITYENEDNPNHKGCNVRLLPVEIVPDDDQPGKTGDQIPSNKGATGEKHYVSPKKSAEIADDFVILKAKGIDQELFEKVLEWEGGEAVPNESLKRRVKRDATGKTVVKLKTKGGGQEVDFMNVWVVWSSGHIDQKTIGKVARQADTSIDGTNTVSTIWSAANPEWKFRFVIDPKSIITDNDRPALDGGNKNPPPGDISPFTLRPLAGGANNKWDVSRSLELRILNPNMIPRGKFSSGYGNFYNGQPQVDSIAVARPKSRIVGNDDSGFADERNNPYNVEVGRFAHAIGEITSIDPPTLWMPDAGGENGDKIEQRIFFREFCRLELNGTWYLISDGLDWRHIQKLEMKNGKFSDVGSEAVQGH